MCRSGGGGGQTGKHYYEYRKLTRDLQSNVEQIKCDLSNASDKVKHESTYAKSKLNQEVNDLLIAIDDQDRQIQNLQKQLRKQAKQISDISLELEASNRSYTDLNENLVESNRRALNMEHEIDDMRANLEKSHIYSSLANEVKKLSSTPSSIPAHYDVRRDPRFLLD